MYSASIGKTSFAFVVILISMLLVGCASTLSVSPEGRTVYNIEDPDYVLRTAGASVDEAPIFRVPCLRKHRQSCECYLIRA